MVPPTFPDTPTPGSVSVSVVAPLLVRVWVTPVNTDAEPERLVMLSLRSCALAKQAQVKPQAPTTKAARLPVYTLPALRCIRLLLKNQAGEFFRSKCVY